jgi:hypothetical protein
LQPKEALDFHRIGATCGLPCIFATNLATLTNITSLIFIQLLIRWRITRWTSLIRDFTYTDDRKPSRLHLRASLGLLRPRNLFSKNVTIAVKNRISPQSSTQPFRTGHLINRRHFSHGCAHPPSISPLNLGYVCWTLHLAHRSGRVEVICQLMHISRQTCISIRIPRAV